MRPEALNDANRIAWNFGHGCLACLAVGRYAALNGFVLATFEPMRKRRGRRQRFDTEERSNGGRTEMGHAGDALRVTGVALRFPVSPCETVTSANSVTW